LADSENIKAATAFSDLPVDSQDVYTTMKTKKQ
jgi:hypothetical protein